MELVYVSVCLDILYVSDPGVSCTDVLHPSQAGGV